MPILWKYLLRSYFQILALSVSAFIAILLVMRFRDIAKFASSGASYLNIALFTIHTIPSILVYAIPISCLIASILLFQRLSHTHELTALRACGIGLKQIAFPLILTGAVLTLVNFTVSSEIAPSSREQSKRMIYAMTAANPLLLLQKETLVKIKDISIDMNMLRSGRLAKDVIVIINNRNNARLGVMTASKLALEGEMLTGKQVCFISSIDSKEEEGFDHLIIENQTNMNTEASNLSHFLHSSEGLTSYDYASLRTLLAKHLLKDYFSWHSFGGLIEEVARRATLGLAAFSFTLVGTAFGMEISRNRSKKGLLWAITLSIVFMICFIAAKSLKHSPWMATLVFLLPHPLMILCSLRAIKRVSRGLT